MIVALFTALVATPAHAQGCPDPGALIQEAWTHYGAAELAKAGDVINLAERALPCQDTLIARDTLLELFRVQALIALSNDDLTAMEAALGRAVAVDARPIAVPPVQFGPELQDAWTSLAAQARDNFVTLSIQGAVSAWIDGVEAAPGTQLRVAPGLHLVQIIREGAVRSRVEGIRRDQSILTLPAPTSAVVPVESPVRPTPVVRRRRPVVLALAAIGAGAASAAALATGARSEASFADSTFQAERYLVCARGAACYADARAAAIRSDANRINAAYGLGYGLAAVSAGLFTVTLTGLPRRRATTD